ncbi:MAG: hypothetical protein NTY66_00640 [Candidatus Vogelbacteria bacterium]|nr:hypothetical protein [Candidatus Vogelbacteria bacterium]
MPEQFNFRPQEEPLFPWENLEELQSLGEEEEDGRKQLRQWEEDHPEEKTSEYVRECGPEVAQFEELISSFEANHPLAELLLIVDLRPEDAPAHPVREPARLGLIPICNLMKVIEEETNISPEKLWELKMMYQKLFQAVGMSRGNKIFHDRHF